MPNSLDFTCLTACKLFAGADGAFDIHYVDADGEEISLDEALKQGKVGQSGSEAAKHETPNKEAYTAAVTQYGWVHK